MWFWIACTFLVAVALTRWVSGLGSAPAPMDEALRADLLDQVARLTSDECRWVCAHLARSPRADQATLQRALSEFPSGRERPGDPQSG